MATKLNNCGTVSQTYFSKAMVEEIKATCESDVFANIYHISSIQELVKSDTSTFITETDKRKVFNLEKNNYIWLRFKK